MSPEEKIKYVKENVDGETAISPSGSIRYHLFSVGHPDNEEWTLLTRSEHKRILYKLEQEGYIKDLSVIGNGDYYALEKVVDSDDKKVEVDFTQKGKTSTDYLIEAVEFFKNEYNKIRIKGVMYEYPLGDNLVQSNFDPGPDEINLPFYRRIAIERLHEVGLVTSFEFEERVVDDYGWVFDYAHCKINEDMLTEPQENPRATNENAEQVVETVIRHEHDHKHRFDNSIQEKPIDFNFNQSTSNTDKKAGYPHTIPAGTRWEDITLMFVNDEHIKISVAGKVHDTGFADMGFVDSRSDTPNMQWHLLRLLAVKNGSLPASDPEAQNRYKQHKKRLADALKAYFTLDTDPFKRYTKQDGYVLKMTIGYQEKTKSPVQAETVTSEIENLFDEYTAR